VKETPVKIPEGGELAAHTLASLFVLVVCGIVLFIAFQAGSSARTIGALVPFLGLIFLVGLRIAGRVLGD
jgi:hypothetical protein